MRANKVILIAFAFCLSIQTMVKAQVSIISLGVQPFNVVPEALLNAGIMNNEGEQQVQLTTQVFGSANTLLMTVKSHVFTLKKGLNTFSSERKVSATEYAGSNPANYIKTTHNLPSGRFKICATLTSLSGADKLDDYCEELEAEFNQYLYLVNPLDGDTIDTKTPMLSWTHSEQFSILNQGEFYRMVVTEIRKGQTAEEAVTVNNPAMVKNYLKEHQIQYPYDAKELKAGMKYGWQVQKMSDGVVINKTEAWMFTVRQALSPSSLKYVALKENLDGGYYTAYDGKVFFKFSEEYKSLGGLHFHLTDVRQKNIEIGIVNDLEKKTKKNDAEIKNSGNNYFELDLDSGNLKSGFYTLKVNNEKRQVFYLKILLP